MKGKGGSERGRPTAACVCVGLSAELVSVCAPEAVFTVMFSCTGVWVCVAFTDVPGSLCCKGWLGGLARTGWKNLSIEN